MRGGASNTLQRHYEYYVYVIWLSENLKMILTLKANAKHALNNL